MEGVETQRNAILRLIEEHFGESNILQLSTTSDKQQKFSKSMILTLPVYTWNDLQILDPNDADFGKFKYMAGYDPIGGSNPIGGP